MAAAAEALVVLTLTVLVLLGITIQTMKRHDNERD